MRNGTRLAAVDLGSNSFRLEIGKYHSGQIERVEYLKETVRQGGGLDENNVLSNAAMQRGWNCLERFSERLADVATDNIRAVGTQTLRQAVNRDAFLARASRILGVPIDVISGREEARLIYQGASSLLPSSLDRRLVVDIGGRSTELILGKNHDIHALNSFQLGSVTWSMRYFPEGKFTQAAFKKAIVAAQALLEEALEFCEHGLWDVAYGCSGTVSAVADVLSASGETEGLVTYDGLQWIQQKLLKARNAKSISLNGMREDRRAVIGGGVSVLLAIFDLLKMKHMHVATGALRQGVLYDLIDREQPKTDIRFQTVARLMEKFSVDSSQAQRVERTALNLFRQLHTDLGDLQEHSERYLSWAARLHEIGAHISHSSYHRHGAYILEHAEAPGFSLPELRHLSQLVLGQRGKLHKLDIDWKDTVFIGALLAFRIAIMLCHARRKPNTNGMQLMLKNSKKSKQSTTGFVLQVSEKWAKQYPQSYFLLEQEVQTWRKVRLNFKLLIQQSKPTEKT